MGDGKVFILPGESFETVIDIGAADDHDTEEAKAEEEKKARRNPGRKVKTK
jgi:hypothetical protein